MKNCTAWPNNAGVWNGPITQFSPLRWHEAYLKLLAERAANWQNGARFYAVASQLMRRI